jgi:glycosyltransferase involved in cell wall biosynthesis
MKKHSILHLVNEVTDCSISRIIANLVMHLDPDGYAWHVGGVSNLDEMARTFETLGVQVVNFSELKGTRGGLRRGVRSYIADHGIDIVHTHNVRTRLVTASAMVGMRGTRHLTTEHLLYRPGDRRGGQIYALLDRVSLYIPDRVVTVSRGMYDEIAAMPLMDARRLTAIQNAIDCDAFYVPAERDPCREELGVAPESYVMGYTGRITSVKGLDTLIKAFARVLAHHSHARLVIIGEGEERPALMSLAQDLGVSDAVIWPGFRQDIARLLAAMDVFVQPSSNEGLSLSILEAMAAAKPVVITDVGGAREVVVDRETGLLVEPGSVEPLSRALGSLMEDSSRGAVLGLAARESVSRQFGAARMAADYEEVYAELVSLPPSQTEASPKDLVERA